MNPMVSKYKENVFKLLKKDEIKSTHQVTKELEKVTKKTISWYCCYGCLVDLQGEGKVQKIKTKAGSFWRKK